MGCHYCPSAYSSHNVNGIWHCPECCQKAFLATGERTLACTDLANQNQGIKAGHGVRFWLLASILVLKACVAAAGLLLLWGEGLHLASDASHAQPGGMFYAEEGHLPPIGEALLAFGIVLFTYGLLPVVFHEWDEALCFLAGREDWSKPDVPRKQQGASP